MKKGDRLPVRIDNFVVGEAIVEGIEEDKVYIRIPETQIVMGYRVELADNLEPETDRLLLGPEE